MNLGRCTALVMHKKSMWKAFLQIFPPNFKHCVRAEIRHVIATKFQPGGQSKISARAESHHEIGPLVIKGKLI